MIVYYGGDINDVEGEMCCIYYVYCDLDLVMGFFIYFGDSGESSVKFVDIDGDGIWDFIYVIFGGFFYVWKIIS